MTLRVALLGAGQMSRMHTAASRQAGGIDVVGIYDQDFERASARASDLSIPRVYRSWPELLGDATVDCVVILLPHDLHAKFGIEALEAGKHVVSEKPLAHSVADCDRMLATAARVGRKLLPVHNRVYDYAAERMAEIVRSGAIGEVILAQTNGYEGPGTVGVRPWLATKAGGGGVLLAQAVHPAYVLRWILGDVARVGCLFGDLKVVDMTSEDTAIATLKFATGALAEMTATFGIAHGPFDHSIALHGRDGYLTLGMNQTGDRQAHPHVLHAISPKLFGDKALHEVEIKPSESWGTGFRRLWEDYRAALVEDRPTRVTGDDGKKAVEIIVAAYHANATGRVVDLPLTDPSL